MKAEIKAILSADMSLFSVLATDTDFGAFVDQVLKPIAGLLNQRSSLDLVNTWGDGIFAVFSSPVECCHFALDLRDIFKKDLKFLGLPAWLGIRISLHVGRVLLITDPIRRGSGYLGRSIATVARVEPVVNPGQIWTTQQMKAHMDGENIQGLRFDDLGPIPLAKSFGTERLYELHRIDEPSSANRTAAALPVIANLETLEMSRRFQVMSSKYNELASSMTDPSMRSMLDELFRLAFLMFGGREDKTPLATQGEQQ